MSECFFNNLSNELLLYIFNYLDVQDLSRLRLTCRRFRDIINAWDGILIRETPIVTNQESEKFLARCFKKIPTKLEKLRLQHNWRYGIYKDKSLFYSRQKYMPWLKLDQENLWFSRGSKIYNHKRNRKTIINGIPNEVFSPQRQQYDYSSRSFVDIADITKFTIRNNILAGSLSDGGVYIQNILNKNDLCIHKAESTYTCSVDISPDLLLVASGMRNDCFKIFTLNQDPLELTLIHTQNLGQRAWCVSFCDDKPLFACGTSAEGDSKKSICLFDTERFTEVMNFSLGNFISATFDMKWDGPNCLWSCGNDSYTRRWDLRTRSCVQKFYDEFGSGLYCLDYDYCNSVIVGTYLHARAALWDTRMEKCVQFYFMKTEKGYTLNSPIYSLAFDAEYLFSAADRNLNILDFTGYTNGVKRDYIKVLSL